MNALAIDRVAMPNIYLHRAKRGSRYTVCGIYIPENWTSQLDVAKSIGYADYHCQACARALAPKPKRLQAPLSIGSVLGGCIGALLMLITITAINPTLVLGWLR